ncbi:MAG: hypothetical protein AB4080_01945 [Trichodesmium sp.]
MSEENQVNQSVDTEDQIIGTDRYHIGNPAEFLKDQRDGRAWEIYREILVKRGIPEGFNGTMEHAHDHEKVAFYALSAAEWFDDAVEHWDS